MKLKIRSLIIKKLIETAKNIEYIDNKNVFYINFTNKK